MLKDNIKKSIDSMRTKISPTDTNTNSETTTKTSFKSKYGLVIAASIVLVIFGLLYYFKGFFIAATVGGKPISRFQVIGALERQYGKQILDSYITEELIQQEAQKQNINIPSSEIDTEIQKVRDNFKASGQTLEDALKQQGMPWNEFYKQVKLQKILEKILGDKVAVTDQEVNDFIEKNKDQLPEGANMDQIKAYVKSDLSQQKFSSSFQQWLLEAKSKNSINYFVSY